MKATYIKQISTGLLYPIHNCWISTNRVEYTDEYGEEIIANGDWEYVEKEVQIHTLTREEAIELAHQERMIVAKKRWAVEDKFWADNNVVAPELFAEKAKHLFLFDEGETFEQWLANVIEDIDEDIKYHDGGVEYTQKKERYLNLSPDEIKYIMDINRLNPQLQCLLHSTT